MTWLVTGGAGYIGSHVVRALSGRGHAARRARRPVLRLRRSSCPTACRSCRPTLLDAGRGRAARCATTTSPGVIHIAGFKYAGVSVSRPLHTYEQNVTATVILLRAMETAGVDKFVFSSSAATYGTPDVDLVTEADRRSPRSRRTARPS